jgi:hypothetical protein
MSAQAWPTLTEQIMRPGARMRLVIVEVKRRCLVCDAETIVAESEQTEAIGPPCAECHAPTERVEVLERSTRQPASNPHAAALGHLGGLKGGPARAAALSPERRRQIARHAARRRWRRVK